MDFAYISNRTATPLASKQRNTITYFYATFTASAWYKDTYLQTQTLRSLLGV
jgi:hypothetical protein